MKGKSCKGRGKKTTKKGAKGMYGIESNDEGNFFKGFNPKGNYYKKEETGQQDEEYSRGSWFGHSRKKKEHPSWFWALFARKKR